MKIIYVVFERVPYGEDTFYGIFSSVAKAKLMIMLIRRSKNPPHGQLQIRQREIDSMKLRE